MNETRTYASLSSGLLARKGTAKPAMRPQAYGSLEDLGWNDMGHAHPVEAEPTPITVDHVPSSIAALTPAPRPGEIDPETFYGEEEEGDPEVNEAAVEVGPVVADSFEPATPVDLELEPELEAPALEPEPEPEAPAPLQEEYSVVAQQRAILERFDGPEEPDPVAGEDEAPVAVPARKASARADIVALPRRTAAKGGRKAAFTLRLDADRHLRLRLACAVTGRSAQQIVSEALDSALAAIPEIESLAERVPVKAGPARAKRN